MPPVWLLDRPPAALWQRRAQGPQYSHESAERQDGVVACTHVRMVTTGRCTVLEMRKGSDFGSRSAVKRKWRAVAERVGTIRI